MFNKSFNLSTCFNPNFILEVDEAERLIRRADAPNEPSYHTACSSRDDLAHEAKITDAWTQAREVRGRKDVANVHEDIEIEDKESELNPERADMTEYPTQDFVILSEVQRMISAGMEKSISNCNNPVWTGLL